MCAARQSREEVFVTSIFSQYSRYSLFKMMVFLSHLSVKRRGSIQLFLVCGKSACNDTSAKQTNAVLKNMSTMQKYILKRRFKKRPLYFQNYSKQQILRHSCSIQRRGAHKEQMVFTISSFCKLKNKTSITYKNAQYLMSKKHE